VGETPFEEFDRKIKSLPKSRSLRNRGLRPICAA